MMNRPSFASGMLALILIGCGQGAPSRSFRAADDTLSSPRPEGSSRQFQAPIDPGTPSVRGPLHPATYYGNEGAVALDASNVPPAYQSKVNAFGWLSIPGGHCSAFHIGNGVAVTAGHCFGAIGVLQQNQPCPYFSVNWGQRACPNGPGTPSCFISSTSQCVNIIAMYTQNGGTQAPGTPDYAFFQVDPIPDTEVPFDPNGGSASPIYDPMGSTATMFGYPENIDAGYSLTMSQCNTVPSQRTSGATGEFQHECSSAGGSSGSAFLDDATGNVYGIHNGEGAIPYGNFGTYLFATTVASAWSQYGGVNVNGKALWPQTLEVDGPSGMVAIFDKSTTTSLGQLAAGQYSITTKADLFAIDGSHIIGWFNVTDAGLIDYQSYENSRFTGRGTHQVAFTLQPNTAYATAMIESVLLN